MPIMKLKTPMKLSMGTTANYLFWWVNQFLILAFDNAKSSLVRCPISSLTAHSTTSLNGIGFARVYSINTSSSSYDYTC